VYTFASMRSYADFHLSRDEEYEDEDGDTHTLGDWATKVEFYPASGLSVWATVLADMGEQEVNRREVGISIGSTDSCLFSISYQDREEYVGQEVYSMGSSLVDFFGESSLLAHTYDAGRAVSTSLQFVLNETTSCRVVYSYDLLERELATQLYEITRDMHCWVGSLRLEEDDGEKRFFLALYLKAFPEVDIDTGL